MIVHHGDAETRSKLIHAELTEKIIGAAIEVHRELGPGLLTYLKLTHKHVGLLFNFHVAVLTRGGIVRKVL